MNHTVKLAVLTAGLIFLAGPAIVAWVKYDDANTYRENVASIEKTRASRANLPVVAITESGRTHYVKCDEASCSSATSVEALELVNFGKDGGFAFPVIDARRLLEGLSPDQVEQLRAELKNYAESERGSSQ